MEESQDKQKLIKKINKLKCSLKESEKIIQEKKKEIHKKRNILEDLIRQKEMKEINEEFEI